MKTLQHGAFVSHIPGIFKLGRHVHRDQTHATGAWTSCSCRGGNHQMVKWALSLALSGEVSQNVRAGTNNEEKNLHTHHLEEVEEWIKADQAERLSLHNTLNVLQNPLDDVYHSDGALMNIGTRQIAHPDVNPDDDISLWQQAMKYFRGCWLGPFLSASWLSQWMWRKNMF